MSLVDNIFVLHGLITHFLNNDKQLFCSFIDFSKAFDYVVRDILWFRTEQNISLLTLRLYNTTYEIIYTDHGQKDNNIIKDTCTV